MSAVFTPSAGGTITYADTGSFTAAGQWREGNDDSESIDAPMHGSDYPTTAGVDGTGVKDYGYRGQKISLTVVYVVATFAGVLSAIQTDLALLAAGPSTLVLDGVTYYACDLDSAASGKRGPTKNTGGGYYWAKVKLVVNAKRNA